MTSTKLSIQSQLSYRLTKPCSLLLQIEAAEAMDQLVHQADLRIMPDAALRRVTAEDGIGHRIWLNAETTFDCTYTALVEIDRPAARLEPLQATALNELGDDIVKYLLPSRYCHPERFFDVTVQNFGGLSGGALILAMCDWMQRHITYDPFASDASTDAFDTLDRKAGVCRDFAHVLIAMARAVAIPARFVSAYGPDVVPQDFHAVAEVYLDGGWHLVDPTGMSAQHDLARIGVGRDAADVSFLTSYGWIDLVAQSVTVQRVNK